MERNTSISFGFYRSTAAGAAAASILLYQTVGRRVGKDHPRAERLRLLELHAGVGGDDEHVAHLRLAGGCAVETDRTAAAPAADHIGVEPFTVGNVPYLHPFALDQVGRLHQLLVDGDASHVIEVRLGNGHPMDFRFQYFDLHHPLRII